MKRVLAWLSGIAAVTVAAAGLLALGMPWWWPLERGVAPDGALELETLEHEVRVVRDPFGVPHVYGEQLDDAFAGLGFAHAQDRLWQMDLLRRAASGRLSELFGAETLAEDRLARTLGFARAAERERKRLRRSTAALLQSYSAGVNGWIEELRAGRQALPFEYRWLGRLPEPWTVDDSLAIVHYRAWLLGRSLDTTLVLDRLVRELGGLASQEFFPRPQETDHMRGLLGSLLPLTHVADRSARVAGARGRVGSHGFVVGASRSHSGAPLLANDPHLELRSPPLFYLAQVSTPDWQVAGGTWPGAPVFWVGTNLSIAWGQVALHTSSSDLFWETLHPEKPGLYDRHGRWVELGRTEERIHVRDGADETLEVLRSRHGPLLGSVLPTESAAAELALQWTGDGASGIEAHLAIQRARDWDTFRAAIEPLAAPAVTYLYADREGNIGSQVAGHLPVRAIDTGLLPVPGRSGLYDWKGAIPFEELPSAYGPELSWRVASTRPPDAEFTRPVSWLWTSPQTRQHTVDWLRRHSDVTLEDVTALQREQRAQAGPAEIRALLEGVELSRGPARALARELLDWDGSTDTDSFGAAVYHVFRHHLSLRLLESRLEESQVQAVIDTAEPMPGMMLTGFLNRIDPEEARTHVERALEQTWSWFGLEVSSNPDKWRWGRIHRLTIAHDFARLGGPWLRWVGRSRRVGPLPVPGSADSMWAMHAGFAPPFEPRVGPVLRFAVDMISPEHPIVDLAGGQSGDPRSRSSVEGLQRWLEGRAHPLWMHAADVSYHAAGVWELAPPPR